MTRIAVIGNSSGGKSTLARRLAARRDLPYVEIDRFLWLPGWELAPSARYEVEHSRIVAQDRWVVDGLGRLESLPSRLDRATEIVLIDLPLPEHLRLAEARQSAWADGRLEDPPAGADEAPQTEVLLQTIREIERDWMPTIRSQVAERRRAGTEVHWLTSLQDIDVYARTNPKEH
jgi:adenylate kinase family enzyme